VPGARVRRCFKESCAAGVAGRGYRSPIRAEKAARPDMRACARITTTAPSTRASHSAACGWTTRSQQHSLRRSRRPGGAPAPEVVGELERQHEERLRGQRLAVERAQYEAPRAERQIDACEPENRLVARTLERAWEQALARLESERRRLAELEARRPEPLTSAERQALARLARDLPGLCGRRGRPPRETARSCLGR
jgi:hypothetical protein